MTYLATADDVRDEAAQASGVAMLQYSMLWLVGVSGAIVFFEPSPYEFTTLASLIVFIATGLRMRPIFLPLLALLLLTNIGYSSSSAYLLDKLPIFNWIVTSWYMAVTVIFFAMVFSEDTAARLHHLGRGAIVGAIIASLAGIAGYLHLVPGGDELLTLYGRARGTFKDPNVLGAFLILPALFALQSLLTDKFSKSARNSVAFGIISLGVLLSFSRAAWGQLIVTSAFVILLTFLTSRSQNQRMRIVLLAFVAVAAAIALLLILLSFDSIADIFKQRASFDQSYDEGRFGRFGRYILGFQMALDLPLGIGPLQFTQFFPEDTHNSYLNAFMSGGWLAGLCFPTLMFTTVIFGFRHLFVQTPWQRAYIVVFAGFLGAFGESFIIDVDHWRHFFLMLGAMWGLFAATRIAMYQTARIPAVAF